MKFPQHRKYKNDQSYFIIHNLESFTEFKKNGSNWDKFEIRAQILPDRVFISDMLEQPSDYWDELTEQEFNEFKLTIDK